LCEGTGRHAGARHQRQFSFAAVAMSFFEQDCIHQQKDCFWYRIAQLFVKGEQAGNGEEHGFLPKARRNISIQFVANIEIHLV